MARMTMNIAWHEANLDNYERSVAQLWEEAIRAEDAANRAQAGFLYYKMQIEEAKRTKKGCFDRDNYLKSRRPT
jgi:hypothetical protein